MRLNLAWTGTLAEFLQCLEHKDAESCRGASSANGYKTLRPTERQQHQPQTVPDPSIAHARGGDHPDPNPARRAPPVHPVHQPVVAAFDVSPDVACDCHRLTSSRRPETSKRFQSERCIYRRERFLACKLPANRVLCVSCEKTVCRTCP